MHVWNAVIERDAQTGVSMKRIFGTVAVAILFGCGGGGKFVSPVGDLAMPAQMDAAVSPDMAVIPHRRVFVTSTKFDGSFGGLSGADSACMTAAASVNLGGQWIAWLSDSHTSAKDRIADVGPWGTSKGIAFNNQAGIAAGPLIPVDEDERGRSLRDSFVWTGTAASGKVDFYNTCRDWTTVNVNDYGRSGLVGATNSDWTARDRTSCVTSNGHLYCFEQ